MKLRHLSRVWRGIFVKADISSNWTCQDRDRLRSTTSSHHGLLTTRLVKSPPTRTYGNCSGLLTTFGGSQGVFVLRAWQPQAAMPAAQKDASRCRVPIYRARAARSQAPGELPCVKLFKRGVSVLCP